MKIIPLSEGTFTVDQSKKFVPYLPEGTTERSAGSLLVEIQPFLVITSKDILLLDAGLGLENPDGTLQLHHNLMSVGINPSEITKVLMSHLHKDHSGGTIHMNNRGGQQQSSFPQATYYIQKAEMEFALQKGFPSFVSEEILALNDNPRIEYLTGNGTIDDYIRYEVTGGHSPHHQVFWIEEEGETIFFGGDEAPQLGQMKSRYAAKYDFDGKKAMQLRQDWREQGKLEGWTFLFYHDFKTPVYKFEK